jgi:hypothetical protein
MLKGTDMALCGIWKDHHMRRRRRSYCFYSEFQEAVIPFTIYHHFDQSPATSVYVLLPLSTTLDSNRHWEFSLGTVSKNCENNCLLLLLSTEVWKNCENWLPLLLHPRTVSEKLGKLRLFPKLH